MSVEQVVMPKCNLFCHLLWFLFKDYNQQPMTY